MISLCVSLGSLESRSRSGAVGETVDLRGDLRNLERGSKKYEMGRRKTIWGYIIMDSCCGQGVSILLEPPQFFWRTRNCYQLFAEGYFRVWTPYIPGCTSGWPSSIPRIWGRMQKDPRHFPEVGGCQCILSLRHINLSIPSVVEIRGA